MTAMNLKTRFATNRANDAVVTGLANVVFGTAEQTLAPLFPCAARHPYPRNWQPERDRRPGAEPSVSGRWISRLASWPGARLGMSHLPKCRLTAGISIAAT